MKKFNYDNLIACRIKAKTRYTLSAILLGVSPVLIGLAILFYFMHIKDEFNNGLYFLVFAFGISGAGLLILSGNSLFRTYSLHKLVNLTLNTGVYAFASIKDVHIPFGEDLSDQGGIKYALTLSFECDGKQEIIKTEYYFGFAQLNIYKELGGVPLYYSPVKKEVIYVKNKLEEPVFAVPEIPESVPESVPENMPEEKANS